MLGRGGKHTKETKIHPSLQYKACRDLLDAITLKVIAISDKTGNNTDTTTKAVVMTEGTGAAASISPIAIV
jgi:hypothetical protein